MRMRTQVKTIEKDLKYLRQISKPIDFSNNDFKKIINNLDEFCKNDENILAIAAIQLGIPFRIIYLKKTKLEKFEDKEYNESKVLINPKIINKEGLTRYWEACASCLNNMGLVERPYKIELEYYDEDKVIHTEIFEGFAATVLSHELDHLDGILHMDKSIELLQMVPEERNEFRKTHPYEIIRKNGEFTEIKKLVKKK